MSARSLDQILGEVWSCSACGHRCSIIECGMPFLDGVPSGEELCCPRCGEPGIAPLSSKAPVLAVIDGALSS